MYLVDLFRNYVNALVGKNQEFEQLLAAKDISAVREKMTTRVNDVMDALKEYVTKEHDIMRREDKIITDKKGKFLRKEEVWKLPIPYPVFINEIALVFLFGRPVKWTQLSEGTDDAFKAYQDFIALLTAGEWTITANSAMAPTELTFVNKSNTADTFKVVLQ